MQDLTSGTGFPQSGNSRTPQEMAHGASLGLGNLRFLPNRRQSACPHPTRPYPRLPSLERKPGYASTSNARVGAFALLGLVHLRIGARNIFVPGPIYSEKGRLPEALRKIWKRDVAVFTHELGLSV